jgi:hypothetical protein
VKFRTGGIRWEIDDFAHMHFDPKSLANANHVVTTRPFAPPLVVHYPTYEGQILNAAELQS